MFLSLSNDSSLCLCPQHMLSCSSFREQLGHGVHKARAFAGYSTSLLFQNTLTKLGLSLSPTKQLVTSDAPFIELESQGVTDFPGGGEISFGASCASVCPAPTFSGLSGLGPPETRSPWRSSSESHCFLSPLALRLALPTGHRTWKTKFFSLDVGCRKGQRENGKRQ